MGEDLLRDFVHDEPPPDWEELKEDLDEYTDIFPMEDEKEEEGFEDEYKDEYEDDYEYEDEWTDIIETEKELDTKTRRVKDDLEEPIWEKDLDDITWSNDIDDLLWGNTVDDDSNWEKVTEELIAESKDIKPTATIEGSKFKSTKAGSSAPTLTTETNSKTYYSKNISVATTKSSSIIPSLHIANKEKSTRHAIPTASSSWSIITKTSLATWSKSIHISLSSIVESATAEDTVSSKINIRTTIPTSVVDIVNKGAVASPGIYSCSPEMPGGYPFEQTHNSIGGMGYIGVFSNDGIHQRNSLNLLLLMFTLVLLFFHD